MTEVRGCIKGEPIRNYHRLEYYEWHEIEKFQKLYDSMAVDFPHQSTNKNSNCGYVRVYLENNDS